MKIKEIIPNIYYAGVNDRVTEKFEQLWPLPYGVSYNSYIVKGEKHVALIDTVRIDEVTEYIAALEESGMEPDLLVINHMEPDHSGSIPTVLERWPNMKIIGNPTTIRMVKGFYGISDDSRFIVVKDGEVLDLGGTSLKFVVTPMVHWPETMMTWVEETKTLFSGDAFGTFGALNGGILDSEMDIEWYWDEMRRYYSNIVGKYGKFVQGAFAKLAGYDLQYICSTHGPVWHEHRAKTISLYDSMSKYESEEGVTIVYGSMYGNTGELAEEIARTLAEEGIRKIKVHNAAHSSMSQMISDAFRYKGLIVGSATYSMGLFPPVEQFMKAMETREIKNKVFATFGSYAWAKGASLKELERYSDRIGLENHSQVQMAMSADTNTREEARALARLVAEKILNS